MKKQRRAAGLTRQRSARVVQRDAALLPQIQQLKGELPFWGYRRIWTSLRFVEQQLVNTKRGLRLMREHHLLVQPNLRLQAKRTPMASKPRPTKPNEWWGIDMTKVLVAGVGWLSIVIVLDWYTTAVVGPYAGLRGTAQQWLEALDMAVTHQCSQGVRGQGMSLMSDHGCQPTSTTCMQTCATLEIHQAFTSDNNPKGNADTERFMRTLKEECLWLQEWTCPLELMRTLKDWLAQYNDHDLHSALGSQSPRQFERDDLNRHSPPFVAAWQTGSITGGATSGRRSHNKLALAVYLRNIR